MAIIIPSKNIYDRNHNKIRDNVIDKVEIDTEEIVLEDKYGDTVFTITKGVYDGQLLYYEDADFMWWATPTDYGGAYKKEYKVGLAKCFDKVVTAYTIKVPLSQENKYIKRLLTNSLEENKLNNITASVYGNTTEYDATGSCEVWWYDEEEGNLDPIQIRNIKLDYTEIEQEEDKKDQLITLPSSIQRPKDPNPSLKPQWGIDGTFDEEQLDIKDVGNIATVGYELIEEYGVEYFKLNLSIMHSFSTVSASGWGEEPDRGDGFAYINNLVGKKTTYEATSVCITIKGDIIAINLQDKVVKISENGNYPYSVKGSEVLQDGNYRSEFLSGNIGGTVGKVNNKWDLMFYTKYSLNIGDTISYEGDVAEIVENRGNNSYVIRVNQSSSFYKNMSQKIYFTSNVYPNSTLLTDSIGQDILTHYSNGKETATLLCSISDYYDKNGNKVIAIDNSTNKMCFRMYDEVEPYVFGANGQDKPLSRTKDGSPKQFQVLGVKPIYDGAVWQELTLQEV